MDPAEPRPRYCLRCGYILDGLPGCRCPECGAAFDPRDSATYSHVLVSGRARLHAATILGLTVAAQVALTAIVGPARVYRLGLTFNSVRVTILCGACLGLAALATRGLRTLLKADAAVRERGALVASVAISIGALALLVVQTLLLILAPARDVMIRFWS
jgi:hypothetical protein